MVLHSGSHLSSVDGKPISMREYFPPVWKEAMLRRPIRTEGSGDVELGEDSTGQSAVRL